jgi:hypothetical protein
LSPSSFLRRLVHFLLTIKFGVVLMIFLMLVMMFATQFEASFGTRAMKSLIYGSFWFDAGVFLFVVNIVVNTWRRRPYRFRHVGFLTVHVGVLTIVTGGLCTRWFGIDGTMPIAEGASNRAISLPDNDLVIEAAGQVTRHHAHYELKPWVEEHRDFYEVPGTPYQIFVDRYFPTGAVVDTVMNDSPEPNPMIELALGASGAEPQSAWLAARDPERSSLSAGAARARFVEPTALPAIREEWAAAGEHAAPIRAGELRLFWSNGRSEPIDVPVVVRGPLPTSRPEVHLEIVQVFRSFVLTGDSYADATDKPPNPAIHFRVHKPDGLESHFSFAAFPDFRADPPEGEQWIVSHAEWQPDEDALHDHGHFAEVAIVEEAPGRFTTWTEWQDPLDGTPLAIGETRVFDKQGVLLRILDAADRGRLTQEVRRVSDEVMRPVLRVHLVEVAESAPLNLASVFDVLRGRRQTKLADCDPNRAWLFHGTQFEFQTAHGPIRVGYEGRSVPLDFAIHLDDFREETYPGVTLAASYESHCVVKPDGGPEFPVRIYMNHPLKHSGYTFYQASFQRTPEGGEVTVLSVARDPGMRVSFVGYCILVAGLLLIFFVKPWFVRLDDRRARRKGVAKEGVAA